MAIIQGQPDSPRDHRLHTIHGYLHAKPVYSLIWTALAESSPGRQSWVYIPTETSPEGTTENAPGRSVLGETEPHPNADK
jgi:hypothetical protein